MENVEKCDIEQHAVLFALFAREIISGFGEKGTPAIRELVKVYASERAGRMKARCLANSDSLSPANYQAYNERSSKPGQMNSVPYAKSPEYIIHVEKCAWKDAWEKYGLLEYGRYYCLDVDRTLTQAFSDGSYEVEILGLKSWGNPYCDFHWGFDMNPETEKYIAKKRESLSHGSILGYDFHTGHLFSCFAKELKRSFGEKGCSVSRRVLDEFCSIFGKNMAKDFASAYPMSEEAKEVLLLLDF